MEKHILVQHLEQIHTTALGEERIRKHLGLSKEEDVIAYCRSKLQDPQCQFIRKGKNWYAKIDHIVMTIHAKRYTIITAHQEKYYLRNDKIEDEVI